MTGRRFLRRTGNRSRNGRDVEPKIELGIDHHQPALMVIRIESILHELRRIGNHLIARIQNRLQDHIQPTTRADRHDHVVFRE